MSKFNNMKHYFKIAIFILICTMFTNNGFSQTQNTTRTSNTVSLSKKEQVALDLQVAQQKKNNETFAKISNEIIQEYVVLRKQGITIPNYPEVISIESITIYLSQLKELSKKPSKNSSAK